MLLLFANHLVRAGLILIVTLIPTVTLAAQPNNLDSKNAISLNEIVRKFQNLNLVTKATYQQLKRLIEQGEILSRSKLLRQLEQDAVNRLLPSELHGKPVNIAVENLTDEMRVELIKLLHQLRESNVISQRVYEKLQANITAGVIKLDIQLFQHAATQMENDEQLQPEVQKHYLNSLQSIGVLSNEGYTNLLQDLKKGNIKDKIEFLKYIDRALIFDLRDYLQDPYDYFPKIHAKVAEMLTKTGVANINFENFALELVKNKDYIGDESYEAIASVYSTSGRYEVHPQS